VFVYLYDLIGDIALRASAAHGVTPHRSSSPRDPPISPRFRRGFRDQKADRHR
jgi:hypothetical protein